MADIVFVGVTTGSSLVHQAMPMWQPVLGVPCTVRGVDIGLDADDDTYVRFLNGLRGDDSAAGVIITGHKVKMFRAGRALFNALDPLALACQEVNAIRRTDDGLAGWARDPVSVGRVTDHIWPDSAGQVICLGAGGTALALACHLFATREPVQFICADPDHGAVEQLTRLARYPIVGHVGNGPWDDLVNSASPGSLIVNATGMGKDRPGSPITSGAQFPSRAVVWELNYRGDLQFLDQALRQAQRSQLQVHDGWQLFCHGWAAGLTVVFDLPDDDTLGDRFAAATDSLRPRLG
jgi:shikimate 5-dehydrogenase